MPSRASSETNSAADWRVNSSACSSNPRSTAAVVNAFDAEQAPWLQTTLYSNFDPYGTRYFIGLNFRPW